MSKRIARAGVLAALACAAAAPAAADWLVLADGGRVETAGPWEVRGGLVVFTLANGTLSSLRASEVDLAASETATEAAKRPAEPPPPAPAKRKARVVMTERDLPPVPVVAATEEGEEAAEGTAQAVAAPPGADPRLVVTDWNATTPDDYDGTIVTGRLRNVSDQLLTRAVVDVLVYNASGTLLGRTSADLPPGPMAPDRVFEFEARLPSVYGVTSARFDVRGVGFLEDEPGGPAGEAPAEPEPEP